MDRNKREKLKRQATAAAVATVASASVMVGGILPDDGVFDDGAEDFPTPIVETVPLRGAGGDAPETGTVAGSEEEKKNVCEEIKKIILTNYSKTDSKIASIRCKKQQRT